MQTTLTPPGYQWRKMRLFTQMELSSPQSPPLTTVFLSFSALSPVGWCFVVTGSYQTYMVINAKGEKGCESPICLYVPGWLLISFGSCSPGWVVSSLCGVFDIHSCARLSCFWLIGGHRGECMLSEWDMSGLSLRRGWCTNTVDLSICNTRNEELKNEVDIATCNRRLLKLQRFQNRYIRCK